jgi:hypothetical protein
MKHKDELRENGRKVAEKDKSWEKWEILYFVGRQISPLFLLIRLL